MDTKLNLKNTKSKMLLNRVIFEQDGGDGGGSDVGGSSGGDSSININYSGGHPDSSSHGYGYYGYGYGHGGGGYGSVKDFYEGLVEPVKDLLSLVFGFGVERISNSIYYAAKKVVLNIPRLFNPATPLIFDDIRDEEKAAYHRIDVRYADTLKEISGWTKNRDLKAIAFMLNPSVMLSAKFIKGAPKAAYRTANVLSGNKIDDFVTRVKESYYALPSQQRSRRRIAELIRKYDSEDKKAAARIRGEEPALSSRIPSGGYYDYDYLEEEKKASSKEELPSNVMFYQTALALFPEVFEEILKEPFEEIKDSGEEAIKNIVKSAKNNIEKIKKVMRTKNLKEFSLATGINELDIIKSIEDSTENILKTKVKDLSKVDDDKKEELKEIISKQIYNQVFNSLKQDYLSIQNIKSIKSELEPLLTDDEIPEEIKKEVKDLLRQI